MKTSLSRRNFQRTVAASALSFPFFSARSSVAAGVIDRRTISPQAEYYHGWPTVTRLGDGELVVVWSGRRVAHVCPFGTVEMMRSRDGGETWSFPRTVHDSPIDDRDAGVLETAEGALLVTSFTSLAYVTHSYSRGKLLEDPAWQAAHRRLAGDEEREAEQGCWGYRSDDGGRSFSHRIDTVVNSPHGPIRLADDRLLYLGKQLWTEEKKVGAAISEDDGRSWRWLSGIPARSGDRAKDYHELHAVECDDGTLVAQIRNHNPANRGETLQTRSLDGGETWSEPRAIGVWGLPSHLLALGDGRLLMTYGYRREPFGNQARVSEDRGETWSDPIALSEDGIGGDLGYPSTVELGDGSLLTIWYELLEGNPKAQLRQARWKLR